MIPNEKSDEPGPTSPRVIDSRRLLYFYHVAKAGRFTSAEAILDVAQSAISRQIQQLETELGTQLLERTGRGVRLTAYGEMLLQRAETILREMDVAIDELEEARHLPMGSISIAAPPSFMAAHMAAVITDFKTTWPGVRICAVEASTGGVYTHLANGQVDLAIVLQAGQTARLDLRELTTEPLYVIAAKDHPIAQQKAISRAQLRELELVVPASLHGSRAILRDYFASEGFPVRSNLEVDSLPLTRELLKRRPVCTILPRSTCEAELDAGVFIARPLKPALTRTLYIARRRDRPASPLVDGLIKSIVKTVPRAPA